MACGPRPLSSDRVVTAEYMQKRRAAQPGCAVGAPVFVDEQRKCDSHLFAKQSRIFHIAKADGGEACSFVLEFLFMRAQLRDVLAAKYSAVMTKEHDHGGTTFPERAEANLIAFTIGKDNVREIAAEGHALGKLSSFRANLRRCPFLVLAQLAGLLRAMVANQ